ncbi:MAG: NAD(P)/FAD-dependent oxidoreductase, partial [Fimbriimonadaceae bacterium]
MLPAVCQILQEIGAWEKVEAQGFPIKIGATYRWGQKKDLWDFNFIPGAKFDDAPRPAKYEGIRTHTAFQVDRSIFDEVLLDHSASKGCEVREQTKVLEVLREGDRVLGLKLESGEIIEAKHYVDASGVSGTLRRTMEIPVDYPTNLRNIAIWYYWQNTDWAVNIGVGGTRIFVTSLGWGWIWFIPIGATRTSIGLVLPLEYYKKSGKKPDELYREAIESEPLISSLMTNATNEGNIFTTNDWSYIADRLSGENWWLIGDSCGFADPILSAGMTLAGAGAKQVAYSILAIEANERDPKWLREFYTDIHRKRIGQHVMFADFWYKSNGQFTDLIDYTSEIAKEAGLNLSPDDAFRWLGTGGFSHEDPSLPIIGGCAVEAVQQINQQLTGQAATWNVASHNVFKMNLEGAEESAMPLMFEGKIWEKVCYRRDGKILPKYGIYDIVMKLL